MHHQQSVPAQWLKYRVTDWPTLSRIRMMVSKDAAKQVTVSGSHKCGSWEIVSVGYSFPRHCR